MSNKVNIYSWLFEEEQRVYQDFEDSYNYLELNKGDPVAALEFLLAQERRSYFDTIFKKLDLLLNF